MNIKTIIEIIIVNLHNIQCRAYIQIGENVILDEPSGTAREVLTRLKRTLVDEELEGKEFVDTNGVIPMCTHMYIKRTRKATIVRHAHKGKTCYIQKVLLPEDRLEPGMFYDLTEVIVESKGNSVTLKLRSYNY